MIIQLAVQFFLNSEANEHMSNQPTENQNLNSTFGTESSQRVTSANEADQILLTADYLNQITLADMILEGLLASESRIIEAAEAADFEKIGRNKLRVLRASLTATHEAERQIHEKMERDFKRICKALKNKAEN